MFAIINLDSFRCSVVQVASRSRVCIFVAHKALHLHIGSIIENVAIEETPEAAQEPQGEP